MLSDLFITRGCCNLYLTQGEGCAPERIRSLAILSLIGRAEMSDPSSHQPGITKRGKKGDQEQAVPSAQMQGGTM